MKDCRKQALKIILEHPVTLSDLLNSVDCVYETMNQHLIDLENIGKISHKKSKFRIFYKPELELEKIEFFELMLNSSTKSTIMLLLKTSKLTSTNTFGTLSNSSLIKQIEKFDNSLKALDTHHERLQCVCI